MKRRRITIGGKSVGAIMRFKEEARTKLMERFGNEKETLEKFVDYLVSSGWDIESVLSVAKQYSNHERPVLQSYYLGPAHVLDQIALQQGTYTNFQDTAEDPNFALRFPGETELTLRRLTSGDLIMLDAAHRVAATYPELTEDSPNYWRIVWRAMCVTFGLPMDSNYVYLPENAFYLAFQAVRDVPYSRFYDIQRTFLRPESRFYVGAQAAFESHRIPGTERYAQALVLSEVQSDDHLFMGACLMSSYAIDERMRDSDMSTPNPDMPHVHAPILALHRYLSMQEFTPIIRKDAEHGNQAPQQPA